MKTFIFRVHPARWFFAAVLAFLFLAGCSTTPKIDWDGRVGNFTYDQAVLELGPPQGMARLTDGTAVADWLTRRGYSHGFVGTGAGVGTTFGAYAPVGTWQPYTSTTTPDYYVRLTFGPDGKLAAWKNVSR
ncbi:MAG: hypothetical protein JWR26_3290 [Pedosphaera sp.]|nr:hypothetical protein [Pedosphaera sp.]